MSSMICKNKSKRRKYNQTSATVPTTERGVGTVAPVMIIVLNTDTIVIAWTAFTLWMTA